MKNKVYTTIAVVAMLLIGGCNNQELGQHNIVTEIGHVHCDTNVVATQQEGYQPFIVVDDNDNEAVVYIPDTVAEFDACEVVAK